MKFNTQEELIEYVNIIGNDRLRTFDITFTPIDITTVVPIVEIPITMNVSEGHVNLLSLSDSPSIKAGFDDAINENLLFVEDYDSIPFSCSTGKVSMLGRTIYTNICENDDSGPVIYLNISLNETTYQNIPFKLKKSQNSNSDYIMLLNPKTLTSNE